jgi:glycine oxidase
MLELGAPPFRRVLRNERCYLVARIDGRVIVGATTERAGFDKTVSPEAVGRLLESGRELAPTLAGALGGEAWAGLRPATPDNLPAVGLLEEGLVAATGHFRNGILLAPVTAKIVAGIVENAAPHPALALLDPTRFARSHASAAASVAAEDAVGE